MLKLETGGKSGSQRQSLFCISAAANEWRLLTQAEFGYNGIHSLGNTTNLGAINPTNIHVLGQALDTNGNVYVALPDNTNVDVTPYVSGKDFYTFNLDKQKSHLDLRTVTFTGSQGIQKDDGTGDYPTPHWTNDEAGLILQSSPTLYTAGSSVQTVTGFEVAGGGSFPLIIKGEVSGGLTTFNLWGTNSPSGTSCSVNTIADTVLTTNTVDFYNPMSIKWSYAAQQANQPLQFLLAGISTNEVYVNWKEPQTANLFHTVVDVACRNAVGRTVESNIVAGIWSDFNGPIPGVKKFDGAEMQYWGAFAWSNRYNPSVCGDTPDLVKYADGKCGAWARFYINTLEVHGVWIPIPSNITTDDNFTNAWTGRGFVVYASSSGQGHFSPSNEFVNHAVVKFDGIIYDPSYGEKFLTELTWEDGSLFSLIYETNGVLFNVPDTKGVQQTTFLP